MLFRDQLEQNNLCENVDLQKRKNKDFYFCFKIKMQNHKLFANDQKCEHDRDKFFKTCASHLVALHYPFCAKRQAEKLEVSFYSSSV